MSSSNPSPRPRRSYLVPAVLVLIAGFFIYDRSALTSRRAELSEVVAFRGTNNATATAPQPDDKPQSSATVDAAKPARSALFSYIQPANAAALSAALPAPTRAIHYVRLNEALIAGKDSPFWQAPGEGRVDLPLPDGGTLSVVIDNSEMLGAGRFTSTGRVVGQPQSSAVFAYNEGYLHVSINDGQHNAYALRTATETLSQFYQIDPTLVPPCAGELHPSDVPELYTAALARAKLSASTDLSSITPGTAAAENPQRAEVHVLMAYTQAVLPTMSGAARTTALQSAFDAEITKTNKILSDSQITARVKLVGIAETSYNENASTSSSVEDDALTALASTTDGKMDELHALRNQLGADIVCLSHQRNDSSSIGQAFVMDTPGSYINADFAFAVVHYPDLAGTTVVPHELGHVFGCAHDRANTTNASGHTYAGAFPYSYGYTFLGANGSRYLDIMAYPPGTELPYYSNPRITIPAPVSRPIGIAAGQTGEADNARTIEQTAFEVAGFRLQTVAAANGGTLINVSTRAYVSTGDSVLIGGFVVDGSQPKTMLIRAAGPALASFGVPDVLANPMLSLRPQGQSQATVNDDWGSTLTGGNSADIAATAAQVGAFPFAPGSQDAALLVTLPPGAYTAVVEGVGGTTGNGLVEAYDVNRTGNKVINLSTRGYADVGAKQMIGGFNVQGTAGVTKRVLVRVLGPSLANYGLSSSLLDDPVLQLRNAAGDLLIENDDWSSGTTAGSASTVNDFSPRVSTYTEKAIAATGLAPSNRRESCVLVDLLPGSYTAMVRPFDLRADQAVRPGVAIIEVYEVNQ